jgi:RND family efflux transporter MFP subunit
VRQVSVDFEPGGVIAAGRPLLRLETEDFQLAVLAKKAALEQARADLALERGHQEVARHEWELLSKEGRAVSSPDLALRKPQLAQAQAKVRQAEASLAQAELDLRRTTVIAPFTALVLQRNVNLGARVSTQETLGRLVDVDQYWVEASVPVDQLPWVTLPAKDSPGAVARIMADGQERAEGHVLRLLGDLESQGRMARILISVPDPLQARPAPILLGEYVRLDIESKQLHDVIRLPRPALRDKDTVWIVRDGRLHIQQVAVVWRDHDAVLVSQGLSSGELVVISDLPTPIAGMRVTLSTQPKVEP